jgi:hypothetical protein
MDHTHTHSDDSITVLFAGERGKNESHCTDLQNPLTNKLASRITVSAS